MEIPAPISAERLANALSLADQALTDSEPWDADALFYQIARIYEELGGDVGD